MKVNNVPVFGTISRNIMFRSNEYLKYQKSSSIIQAIKNIKSVYAQRGFTVTVMNMDGKFEDLREDIISLDIYLNIVSRNESVPEIERSNRAVKERVRAFVQTLPFKKIPRRVIIEIVKETTFWLNVFPVKNGISRVLTPRTIVTGRTLDYKIHCKIEYGIYVQILEHHDNSMSACSTGVTTLRLSDNQ